MNRPIAIDPAGLKERIDGFVAGVDKIIKAHYAANLENLIPPSLSAKPGNRYVRIEKADAKGSSRSVYCFIDRSNGDILKAASWRAPAKHARGNVFENDFGLKSSGAGPHGVRYL